jgi:hypothetical protein
MTLKNNLLNSELKYILSLPNCGILDLDSAEIDRDGDQYPIRNGLTSDTLGPNAILTIGSRYLNFKIDNITISQFDPDLYRTIYDETSSEGLSVKDTSGMTRSYVPIGTSDDYLASFNLITSPAGGSAQTPLLSSFAVIVKIQNNKVTGCRGVNSINTVSNLCNQSGGSWNQESLICQRESTNGNGVPDSCPMNDVCNTEAQFKL